MAAATTSMKDGNDSSTNKLPHGFLKWQMICCVAHLVLLEHTSLPASSSHPSSDETVIVVLFFGYFSVAYSRSSFGVIIPHMKSDRSIRFGNVEAGYMSGAVPSLIKQLRNHTL